MKRITFILSLLASCAMQSQITYEAAKDFGKLEDLTYDLTVQNKIYALTQGNHIVVSSDNGATWSLKYSFPDTGAWLTDLKLKANTLSFSVRNAGMAVDGIYILNNADNAVIRHIPIPNPEDFSTITSYDLSDATGNTVIAHTSYSEGLSARTKIFISKDAGTNWQLIYFSVDNDNVHANNVAISPLDNNKLFIARSLGPDGINGGLLISTNGGLTFTESLAGIALDPIAFNPTNGNDILIGTSISFGASPEGLYRSSNGGTTWTLVPITWTDQTLNSINKIAFHPTAANNIILLEENEIAKSTDGGATWSNIVYPEYSTSYYYGLNASYNPSNTNQIAITTDLFPQMSNDGGTTLTQIQAPFYNIISVDQAKNSTAKHLFYGSNGGRIHKNLTTGTTSVFEPEAPTSFNPKKNYIVADQNILGRTFTYASMGFFGGNLVLSNDYGATTTVLANSFADDIQELIVDPNNSNVIYVAFRSGENGTLQKINFADLDNIIVEDIITPEIDEFGTGAVTGIAVTQGNSNEIFISKSAKFFKSIDGGATWVEKMNGLTVNQGSDLIWDMQRNPLNPNHFSVATNVGVFSTSNAGENWTSILSGVDAKRINYSPANDGVMVVSLFSTMYQDTSIQYTANAGQTWSEVNPAQLNYINSYSMAYDFDGNNINAYIATTDLGVLKYTIENVTLGVNNPNANANAISIYPNPASNQLNVVATGNAFEIKNTLIYTLTGQKVLESNASTIDISRLNTGIYIVNVVTDNGTIHTQKLIKK